MAKVADTSLKDASAPMMAQLQKARKQISTPSGGRQYNGTSQKAVKRGAPVADGKKRLSSWNPEKSPANKTGVNTEFEDYAPRGYYPPRNGETRVLEQADYTPKIPTKKLHEKG